MKYATALLVMTLMSVGFSGHAIAQAEEGYDPEGGVNWFGDYDEESAGIYDQPSYGEYGEEEGFYTETFGYGYYSDEPVADSDQYGYYDSEYDWNTDDEWFEDWYGDSDEWF